MHKSYRNFQSGQNLTTFYLQKNLKDFDMRTALHRAVMNARILSVSYLLGIAADPNLKDRWGNTALDVALQGESTYHMYEMHRRNSFQLYGDVFFVSDSVLDLYSIWEADCPVLLVQREEKSG